MLTLSKILHYFQSYLWCNTELENLETRIRDYRYLMTAMHLFSPKKLVSHIHKTLYSLHISLIQLTKYTVSIRWQALWQIQKKGFENKRGRGGGFVSVILLFCVGSVLARREFWTKETRFKMRTLQWLCNPTKTTACLETRTLHEGCFYIRISRLPRFVNNEQNFLNRATPFKRGWTVEIK